MATSSGCRSRRRSWCRSPTARQPSGPSVRQSPPTRRATACVRGCAATTGWGVGTTSSWSTSPTDVRSGAPRARGRVGHANAGARGVEVPADRRPHVCTDPRRDPPVLVTHSRSAIRRPARRARPGTAARPRPELRRRRQHRPQDRAPGRRRARRPRGRDRGGPRLADPRSAGGRGRRDRHRGRPHLAPVLRAVRGRPARRHGGRGRRHAARLAALARATRARGRSWPTCPTTSPPRSCSTCSRRACRRADGRDRAARGGRAAGGGARSTAYGTVSVKVAWWATATVVGQGAAERVHPAAPTSCRPSWTIRRHAPRLDADRAPCSTLVEPASTSGARCSAARSAARSTPEQLDGGRRPPEARAEELAVEDWCRLARLLPRERAPAKLTRSLRVAGVRADGYHLIDAEMVTLDLADELTFSERRRPRATHRRRTASLPVCRPTTNLVRRRWPSAGRAADVQLDKRIPSGAGLGGGSADAAAVLRWAGIDDLGRGGRARRRRAVLRRRRPGPRHRDRRDRRDRCPVGLVIFTLLPADPRQHARGLPGLGRPRRPTGRRRQRSRAGGAGGRRRSWHDVARSLGDPARG